MTADHTLLFQSFDMRFFCLVVWLIGWVLVGLADGLPEGDS